MSNKSLGNTFEREFCKRLHEAGFWVHNFAQKAVGQPVDIIAVRDNKTYLIDCKVCSGNSFDKRRIEENQRFAMKLFKEAGNNEGLFALEWANKEVTMITISKLEKCRTREDIIANGMSLERWLRKH